jgi:uncharacterized protein
MHNFIPFFEISEHGVHLKPDALSWLPDDLAKREGPVSAKLFLIKKGEHKIEIQGRLQGLLRLSCDRCLAEYVYTVDDPFQLIAEVADEQHWCMQHLEGCAEDLETVLFDEPCIDINDLLRQQLLLALPEKQLCRDSCQGLCCECGINLNLGNCTCARKPKDSPFAVLAQLRENK